MPIALVAVLLSKLRSRFGVETDAGQNANLSLTIVPVTQIDPLALVNVGNSKTVSPGSTGTDTIFTVPPGEFWHLKAITREDSAVTDYTYHLTLKVNGGNPTIPLSTSVVAAGAAAPVPLLLPGGNMVLQAGDQLLQDTTVWVADGAGTLWKFFYAREDCAP